MCGFTSELLLARISKWNLKTPQFAYLLEVSEATFRRWLSCGRIQCRGRNRRRLEAFFSGKLDLFAEILVKLYPEANWREQADRLFRECRTLLARGASSAELSELYKTSLLKYLEDASCV